MRKEGQVTKEVARRTANTKTEKWPWRRGRGLPGKVLEADVSPGSGWQGGRSSVRLGGRKVTGGGSGGEQGYFKAEET